MDKVQYTTKKGDQQFKPTCTGEEYRVLRDDMTGWCLACGNEQEGVEQDARRYDCEACNAPKVFGLEQLMLMGLIQLKEAE